MRLLAPIVSVLCFLNLQGWAQDFTAHGTIRYDLFNTSAEITYSLEKTFEISRSDCMWWIQTKPKPGAEGSGGVVYDEVGCNGADVFLLRVFDPKAIKGKPAETDGLGRPMNTYLDNAKVFGGVVPPANSTFVHPIWLAYASSCFLELAADNKVKPVQIVSEDLLFTDPGYLQTAAWRLNDDKFLHEMVYFSEGTSLWLQNGVMKTNKFSPPFDQGFTNAYYQTVRFTNINDIALPAEFVLLCYRPQGTGKTSNDLSVASRFTGKILGVSRSSRSDFYPVLTRPQLVDDYRFVSQQAGRFSYAQPGGWFVSTNDPKLLPMLKMHIAVNPVSKQMQREREASLRPPIQKKKRTYVGIAFLALIPIVAFSIWKSKNGKK